MFPKEYNMGWSCLVTGVAELGTSTLPYHILSKSLLLLKERRKEETQKEKENQDQWRDRQKIQEYRIDPEHMN